jgi:chromosome segregation ATPase
VELTSQVKQWKRSDAAKAEELATVSKKVEQLQHDLSNSSSRITQFQQRYEAKSAELSFVREQLQATSSLGEGKDVAALKAQIERWKRADADKADELEQLQRKLNALSFELDALRKSTSISEETRKVYEKITTEQKDYAAIIKLTTTTDEWLHADARRAKGLALELARRNKENEELRHNLVILKEIYIRAPALKQIFQSETIEFQKRYEVEQLQHDLSISSSGITQLQRRYKAQSAELSPVREQLHSDTFGLLGGDSDVTTLKAQIERWKRADADKAEELEQLQRKLNALSFELDALKKSTSISEETRKVYEKITTEQKDYAAIIKLTTTTDVWLRADAWRAEELALELAKRDKENEELRYNLVALKEIYIRAPALKQIFQSETIEVQIRKRVEEESTKLKSALAMCQSQLDDVQRFITTADKYADTMIIQMLHTLNAEVQQNTGFMAERILKDFGPRATKLSKEQSSAAQRVSESIGNTLAGCLGSDKRNDVALYLPIAFQAYLTYYLHSVISSWTIKKDRDQFINEIYERLQKSGKN